MKPVLNGAFGRRAMLERMLIEEPGGALVDALQAQWGGASVQRIETHISWVLLVGDTAWKIKKPVNLGFLDFSKLAARRHFCDEELRLNRPWAPSIYLEVVAITGSVDAPRIGGEGPAIEFALKMRRFPPRALLSEKLTDGTLQPAHLDALAARVAAVHRDAPVAPPGSRWGSADEVAEETRAVLRRLQQRGADVADLQRGFDGVVPALRPLWQRRQQDGAVRECHGDLHLRNAVVLDDGVTAFDCLEFDPALRWIDMQSDIAFMTMDLLAHGRPALAWRFVNAWLDASGDHAGVPVLRPYLVHRALVRAMVARIEAAQGAAAGSAAEHYLALARRVAFQPAPPRLLVTHGLSGSGKTFVTQGLLELTGAVRLRSDVERKRLHGLSALQASGAHVAGGIYGQDANTRTYGRLAELARGLLAAGHPVIIDAACLRRSERAQMRGLALEAGVPFLILDCQAAIATLRQRIQARQQRGDDASEADLSVLDFQLGIDEPLAPDEAAMRIDTDQAPDLPAIAARWR